MVHLLRAEEGCPLAITTVNGLPQGCPSAPLALSMAMASPEEGFYRIIAGAQVNPNTVYLNMYMYDVTLVAAPEAADKCFEALGHTLAEAGMKLKEDIHTVDH